MENNYRFLEGSEERGVRLSIETLVLVLMLIFYITIGPLLRRKKINFLRASGLTMIIGIICTLLIHIIFKNTKFAEGFQFNNIFFFTFVLPLIIFSAGYNTVIVSFFKYFRHILIFSFSGTLLTFMIISFCTYVLSNNNKFYFTKTDIEDVRNKEIKFTLVEILQFSSAISASDSIFSYSFFMEDEESKLNVIGFGESIINNAFCIALFKIVSRLNEKEDKTFTLIIVWEILYKCIILFIFSTIIGGIIGILFALLLKFIRSFHLNRIQQIGLMLLFAFISYIFCDLIHLSSMISLLSCGLFMSHYAFYNLSYQTREESTLISLSLSTLAEALVFSSLGMTLVYYTTQALSISFIVWQIILIVICRIITIYGQIYILEKCGASPFLLSLSHQGILTGTGLMRGAVSFGLAISIKTRNPLYKEVTTTSIIYIVFLTNIVLTLILSIFYRKMRIFDNQQILKPEEKTNINKYMNEDIFTFLHRNTQLKKEKIKRIQSQGTLNYNQSLTKIINDFDEQKIIPNIIINWPECKEDNDNIGMLIQKNLKKWAENKNNLKNNENEDNYSTPITMEEVANAQTKENNNKYEMKDLNININN